MATEDDVRGVAKDLPQVTEGSSYNTAAYYVARKIFARMHEEPGVLICWRDSLEEREALLAADSTKFFTTDHYKGHASVLVRLENVDVDELSELLTEAWYARAPKRVIASYENYAE